MNYKIKTKGKGKKIVKLFRELGYGDESDVNNENITKGPYVLAEKEEIIRCQIYSCGDKGFFKAQKHQKITYKKLKQLVREKKGRKIELKNEDETQSEKLLILSTLDWNSVNDKDQRIQDLETIVLRLTNQLKEKKIKHE